DPAPDPSRSSPEQKTRLGRGAIQEMSKTARPKPPPFQLPLKQRKAPEFPHQRRQGWAFESETSSDPATNPGRDRSQKHEDIDSPQLRPRGDPQVAVTLPAPANASHLGHRAEIKGQGGGQCHPREPRGIIRVALVMEGPQAPSPEVREPAEGIEQFPAPRGEPDRHRIDGEVPAEEILVNRFWKHLSEGGRMAVLFPPGGDPIKAQAVLKDEGGRSKPRVNRDPCS